MIVGTEDGSVVEELEAGPDEVRHHRGDGLVLPSRQLRVRRRHRLVDEQPGVAGQVPC